MFKDNKAFSSFSVNDVSKAKEFYEGLLGLNVSDEKEGGIAIHLTDGGNVYLYPKPNHEPASFTVLNFQVSSVDEAIDALIAKGVKFNIYNEKDFKTDERGKFTDGGPVIAWFNDPSGNVLSIVENNV